MQRALGMTSSVYKLDMIVMHACKTSTFQVEEADQESKAALIHGDLEASVGYMRPRPK